MLGVIIAVWMSERRWRARGGAPGTMIDIAVPAVIFGLIGGRLYHVITDWQLYFGPEAPNEPYEALFIWNGGLGIWGAVALGGVGVWLTCRKRGISLSAVADTVAPGIAIGQAIGRWGNWFNQELYGGPTDLPWGLEIDINKDGTVDGLYHPTFLYESIWNLILAFVLIWAGKRFTLRHGRLFALYVAGYTLGRFWIEGLRIDPVGGVDHAVTFLSLRINQWTALVLFVAALAFFFLTRGKDTVEYVLPRDGSGPPGEGESADPAHAADQADESDTVREADTAEKTAEDAEDGEPAKAEASADEPAADEPAKTDEAVKIDEPAKPAETTAKADEAAKPAETDVPVAKTDEPVKDDAVKDDAVKDDAEAVREEEKNPR
ncbi:prolipoprotein diacylglyceryl transferase [Nonomuraea endophytica]|uniref:Phosphatidylglycerol--prolipoprotein diacylglyceryl transferase n=1 Tax=Nonomuraea endophytica TaxID=714136 RepID=A0A7W8A2G0_9ACTN|nr:prolipoprotein diacylglyceryl transferase [Nonomuraea endophytica]